MTKVTKAEKERRIQETLQALIDGYGTSEPVLLLPIFLKSGAVHAEMSCITYIKPI